MNEYDVRRKLAQRSEKVNNDSAPQMTNGIPNSVLADVFSGKQKASSEMMGHRSNLAPSIAAKMSQSFGMDVSGVQVYRSDAMAGSTMHGMAQGNKVVLSSDVDLNTLEGQAVLGHELSHIRAQGMGIGTGNGLLSDAGLEHQADTEGMLAARGMNISGESMGMSMGLGMAGLEGLQPIGAGMGASAAAPMQADQEKDDNNDLKAYNTIMGKNARDRSDKEKAKLAKLNGKIGGIKERVYMRNVEKSGNFPEVSLKMIKERQGGQVEQDRENMRGLLHDKEAWWQYCKLRNSGNYEPDYAAFTLRQNGYEFRKAEQLDSVTGNWADSMPKTEQISKNQRVKDARKNLFTGTQRKLNMDAYVKNKYAPNVVFNEMLGEEDDI